MPKKLVAGNWKMHGDSGSNSALLDGLRSAASGLTCEVAVCVPFPYLYQARHALTGSPVAWGAQNVSDFGSGAYTGEVSGAMLKDFSCRYVLVGHSERRTLYGEGDRLVARKFAAAQEQGLIPVLCVGETLGEREEGATMHVVRRQLGAVLELAGVTALRSAVVAYEPVWAIGTGRTATPAQAQEVHLAIRSMVAEQDGDVARELRILYGGSVKPQNAQELFAQKDIDGGLIGGASLVLDDFLAICRAAV